MCFERQKLYLRLNFCSGSNPGFVLNHPGLNFCEKPGFFGSGSNPGSIPIFHLKDWNFSTKLGRLQILNNLPTIKRSFDGKLVKIFLKSSDLDL